MHFIISLDGSKYRYRLTIFLSTTMMVPKKCAQVTLSDNDNEKQIGS